MDINQNKRTYPKHWCTIVFRDDYIYSAEKMFNQIIDILFSLVYNEFVYLCPFYKMNYKETENGRV